MPAFQIPVYGEVYPESNPGMLMVSDESQDVLHTDASPVTVGTLKSGVYGKDIVIVGVIANIKTAYAGTAPTLQIGVAADPDKYGSNTEIAAATAGMKKFWALGTALEEAPSADVPIIVTIGGTGLSAGIASFRLVYFNLASLT